MANFIQNLKPIDIPFEDLNGIGENVNVYPKKLYDYYAQNINNALEQLTPYIDSLGQDARLAKLDLYNILDMYTKKWMKDLLTEDSLAAKVYNNCKIFAIDTFNY